MVTDVLAFDIYGTILDTRAIASKISESTGINSNDASTVSQTFRTLQLEYTWRLSLMGLYEPFDAVTKRALEQALAEHQVQTQSSVVEDIMDVYIKRLQPFEGALRALEALSKKANIRLVVFTNGNYEMVSAALKSASLMDYADGVHSADMIKLYKPARRIYESLVEYINTEDGRLSGVSVAPDHVWLVSGNPFDVTGARSAGLQAIWVNPGGPEAWKDRAVDLKPTKVVRSLEEVQALF